MILLVDNFDSFTYNLVDYFEQLGVQCKVFRNNVPLEEIQSFKYEGLVLSPGPSIPENSGNLASVIKYYYDQLPILGICLGHQAIGQFFGARLHKAIKPMHGKISKIKVKHDPIFRGLEQYFEVVRYHSLILSLSPDHPIIPLAYTEENELMALRHKVLPIWGLQFHPEAALTQYGLEILGNWISINGIIT
ncbi:MAG: aminodeoxychorismate/anthranilate synthase component II [Bacteroidota bacterium]